MIKIPRDVFYETLKNSPNLSYVEEIDGFKKSKSTVVDLFEVMKRLDAYDIACLAYAIGRFDLYMFIVDSYVVQCPNGLVAITDGFDCYLPPEERRDYRIKMFCKGLIKNEVSEHEKLSKEQTISKLQEVFKK